MLNHKLLIRLLCTFTICKSVDNFVFLYATTPYTHHENIELILHNNKQLTSDCSIHSDVQDSFCVLVEHVRDLHDAITQGWVICISEFRHGMLDSIQDSIDIYYIWCRPYLILYVTTFSVLNCHIHYYLISYITLL